MNDRTNRGIVARLAASATLVATVAVGCTPSAPPATLSSLAPRAGPQAARIARSAAAALAANDAAKAVRLAEDAVTIDPQVATHRVLLGRAYIAAGRFVSAEAALTDALTLNPGDGQAELSLALTRIALGKWDQARGMLAAARGKVGEADRGLALALAGDKEGGVQVLEGAARAPGADAKTRQNYALGLALAGRWAEARSVAAQDLSPEFLRTRMSEWAALSQPRDAWDQVAALLHVTPIEDGGMPVALALNPAAAPVALASADTGPPAPLLTAGTVRIAIAGPTATMATDPTDPADPVDAADPADVPPIADDGAARPTIAAMALPAAPPVATPVMRQAAFVAPSLIASPSGRLLMATRPRVRQSVAGRFVVQLGAFSSTAKVENAWRETIRRIDRVAAFAPSQATFGTQKVGTVYRLSLAGFGTRDEAATLCRRIRIARGECFVRPAAGDALARFGGGVRLAMR